MMYERPRRSTAATKRCFARAWSSKNVRTTGAWCLPDWMEPDGATCTRIPRQTAGKSFKRARHNVLTAEPDTSPCRFLLAASWKFASKFMRQATERLSARRATTRFRRCADGYRRDYRAARRIVGQPPPNHPQYRSRWPSPPARWRSGSWSQTRTNNSLSLPLTTRPTEESNEVSRPLIRPGVAARIFHGPGINKYDISMRYVSPTQYPRTKMETSGLDHSFRPSNPWDIEMAHAIRNGPPTRSQSTSV